MPAPSKIPLLEQALGGLTPGHAYLIHGGPAVGKTVLSLQVSHAWAQAGGRAVYLTADAPEDVLEQASLLGLSLEPAWRSGRFILCAHGPRVARQVRDHGMEALLARLAEQADPQTPTALVCDPVTPFFSAMRRSEAGRAASLLFDRLREWGWCSVLLARSGELRRPRGMLDILSQGCQGVLELTRLTGARDANESPFALRVVKSSQPASTGTVVPYAIALEVGLVASPGAECEPDPRTEDHEHRRARALIACAERDALEPLIDLLRRSMHVEVVCDGVDALSRAATWRPEVVVVQPDLPRLGGLSLTRALRQGRYTMPIVVLSSGERRRSDRVRALLCGATDFVEGPFDLREAAFRIRMASRVRVRAPEIGTEEHRLLSLLEKGRYPVVELPEFLEMTGIALRRAVHFSTPVSLVTFAFDGDGASARETALWDRLCGVLTRGVRAGDLVCFPGPRRAATLLCHENHYGARAFGERLRDRVSRELGSAALEVLERRLQAGRLTLEGETAETIDLSELLASAFRMPQPLFAEDERPGLAEAPRPTGTDGQ